jgi:CRISPR-associated protein Csx10
MSEPTDLILRDSSGQVITAQPGDLIPELAGSELESAYMEGTFIGGFNRKWGLPLPQVPAVKAGSVFVYKYQSDFVTEDWIHNLEREGIGERKTEGFGRIAINWLEQEEFDLEKPDSPDSIEPQPLKSIDLATKIAEKILRQKLDSWLLNQVCPSTEEVYKREINLNVGARLNRQIVC